MKSETFKNFYRNELKINKKLQEYLFQMGKIDLLKELLKDETYNFDNKHILIYLEDYLTKLDKGIPFDKKRIS